MAKLNGDKVKTMWISVLLIGTVLLAAGCGDRSSKSASEDDNMREQPVPAKIRYFNKAKKVVLIKPLDSLVVKMTYADAGGASHTIRHGTATGQHPSGQRSLNLNNTKQLQPGNDDLIVILGYGFPNGSTNIVTKSLVFLVEIQHSAAQLLSVPVALPGGANDDFVGAITVFVTEAPASGGRVTYTVDCVAGYRADNNLAMQSAHQKATVTSP